jgi:N-acetylglutamate synthase-like GNAT family acetyltransferase
MKARHPNKGEETVTVRTAQHGDLPRIAELLSELGGATLTLKEAANRLALVARNAKEVMLVACADKNVVGLLAFRVRHNLESVSHYGEVAAIVVDNAWRKRGIGRLLLEKAESIARHRKCVGLWLVSGFGREEPAHSFYQREGFACTGKRFVKRFQ